MQLLRHAALEAPRSALVSGNITVLPTSVLSAEIDGWRQYSVPVVCTNAEIASRRDVACAGGISTKRFPSAGCPRQS